MYTQTKKEHIANQAVCPTCKSTRMLFSKGRLSCTNCNTEIGKINKTNKYGAKRTEMKGTIYDSTLEANYAHQFDLMLRAGQLTKVEKQVPIILKAYGKKICTYKIDFILHHATGEKEYAEIKGMELPLWRMKWKLLEAQVQATEPGSILKVYK